MNRIDHFAWSSPSLERAIDDLERLSGVRARIGGSHPGMGTCNALVSLGPNLYLALDAPDPAQELRGNNGARMAAQGGYNMDLFAVSTDDIEAARELLCRLGVYSEIRAGGRETPDGTDLKWRYLLTDPTPYGCAMPHISQWDTDNHPSLDAPKGCSLERFVVHHPSADAVGALYDALGLEIETVDGATASLQVALRGGHGVFDLPTGFN